VHLTELLVNPSMVSTFRGFREARIFIIDGGGCRRVMTRLTRVVFAVIAVVLLAAGVASAQSATYQATETIPVPPASDYAGSGGGDGWAVALSSSEVFNVFHHSSTLNVACHYQSDASPCWGPDEITDSDGGSFSTSGQPGLWFDQVNGDLYVYATRNSDSTAGVVCIDTADAAVESDPFCGFTALTNSGQAPQSSSGISQVSDPVLVAGKWYAFNFDDGATPTDGANQLLCFDTSTLQACSGQPYSVPVGSGEDDDTSYPPPAVSAIGDHIIVPITIAGSPELGCFDGATGSACSGTWPVSTSSQYAPSSDGAAYPYLSASGTITGLCLPTGSDPCYDLSGNSIATPPNMTTTIGATSGWNGPGLTIGPRVYVPDGNLNQVDCYDYSTQDSCANFPDQLSNLSLLYTVNPDPQRPTCIWVNSDNGSEQIQNLDAYTGGACGEGPVRVLASSLVAPSAQCVPYSYSKIQVLDPSPSSYSSGSVQFEDGDGNPIPGAATAALDQTGSASLAGLSLNTVTGLPQFLITLQTGAQAPQEVQVQLTWTGLADQACEGGSQTVTGTPSGPGTGSGSGAGSGSGVPQSLDRAWPSHGLGYGFANESLFTYENAADLNLGDILTVPGLRNEFTDFDKFAAGAGELTELEILGQDIEETNGLCVGEALSAGRFDGGTDVLAAPSRGRTAPEWAGADGDPMKLPAPSHSASSAYDEQLLRLLADDHLAQWSVQYDDSLFDQHYAYAVPTVGFQRLKAQLISVMASGRDGYGSLSGPSNGFALLDIESYNNGPPSALGHELLAYSLALLSDGGLDIGVVDSNFPDRHYDILVHPNGTWTYDAPYRYRDFSDVYSMSGAPGYHVGLLAAFPLFQPSGLQLNPSELPSGTASGAIANLRPGTAARAISAGNGGTNRADPLAADTGAMRAGSLIDLGTGTARMTLTGANPGITVRSADDLLTAAGMKSRGAVDVSVEPASGTIAASGARTALAVTRPSVSVTATGAGSLTLAADGKIVTKSDHGQLTLAAITSYDGVRHVATLFDGKGPRDGGKTFSAVQVHAAERAAAAQLRILPRVRASSNGLVRAGVRCVGKARTRCRGVLELEMVRRHGAMTHVVELGKANYAVKGRSAGTARIKLNLLARRRAVAARRVDIVAVPTQGAGSTRVLRSTQLRVLR
jgi:hypothetical protein